MGKTLTGTTVERVHAIKDQIVKGGDEAQQIRRLPGWLAQSMIDQGLYRFALPRELGGEDASVRGTIEVLEAVAAIDASVGWNIMIGSEINALVAGGCPEPQAKEIYGDWNVIMCGGGGPGTQPSRALREEGGWRVFAQSTFMSGCHDATYAVQTAPLFDGEQPMLNEAGQPIIRSFLIPRDQFEILDTWDVAALRGSGSADVRTNGAFISDYWSEVQLFQLPTPYENPVHRIPTSTRLSYNKAAVATGIARGVIDEFVSLAQTKTPFLSATSLKERPMAQYRLGEAEATLRAARAFLFEAMDGVTDSLAGGAQEPAWDAIKIARLACTHAAQSCRVIVDSLHNASGTTGIRMNSPLERKLRDAHGAASHRWVGPQLYEEAGKVLMGLPPGPGIM
jgi:alkylation response protein AidB-like acyl-CoA dehydrogenase